MSEPLFLHAVEVNRSCRGGCFLLSRHCKRSVCCCCHAFFIITRKHTTALLSISTVGKHERSGSFYFCMHHVLSGQYLGKASPVGLSGGSGTVRKNTPFLCHSRICEARDFMLTRKYTIWTYSEPKFDWTTMWRTRQNIRHLYNLSITKIKKFAESLSLSIFALFRED